MVTNNPSRAPAERGRVLLVRLPPFLGFKNHHPRDVTLPLTIGYIGTMAQEAGWNVAVLDVWGVERTMAQVLAEIRAAQPDVIVFEVHASPFPIIMRCAEAVRAFSGARMVAYGSVPTYMPERVVGSQLPIDVALAGECEFTALELLEALAQGAPIRNIEGLAFWDEAQQQVHRTPRRAPIDDLDSLPIINYGMLDLTKYRKLSFPVPVHRRVRWGHVLATRGCPYPCTHCSFDHRQSFGRSFRKHSPKRVVDEMELLATRYGINAISIEDDIFTMERQYAVDICEELVQRGVKVKWVIQTRVDCIDRPLLQKMKQAGCVGVSLGIESGNDRVLEHLKKGFSRAQALEGIKICQEEGLMMRLLFMVGNPTETADEIEDTIDLVCQAKAITIQVHISTPYPGTSLLGDAEADGEYIDDFTSYNKIVHNISNVPDDVLWALQKKFYRKYFFSLRYLKLFLRQRLMYIAGSWRHDVPLFARAFWYLAFSSRQQGVRDVQGEFDGIDQAVRPAADASSCAPSPPSPLVVLRCPDLAGKETAGANGDTESAKKIA